MVFEPLLADYSWFLCDFLSLLHKLRNFISIFSGIYLPQITEICKLLPEICKLLPASMWCRFLDEITKTVKN